MPNVSDKRIIEVVQKHGGSFVKAAKELKLPRSTVRNRFGQAFIHRTQEKIEVHEEHKLKKQLREQQKATKEQIERCEELERKCDEYERIMRKNYSTPKWLAPKRPKKNEAIASAMVSDLHLDECVSPEEFNFINAYNRSIAEMRVKELSENVIKLGRDYMGGVNCQKLIMPFGGDFVSGEIHDELTQTNEAVITETVDYWAEKLAAMVLHQLSFYDSVYVPCVSGNHGRLTKKPRMKKKATHNFDWMLYRMVALHLKDVKEISFDIPRSTEARWQVFGTRYQMTHGDQFRGGNGIGGIQVPIKRGDAKKRMREQAVNTPYDILIMGHWHQLIFDQGLIINGSLKGYDEYAFQSNFGYEPPQQAFWLTDPVHGRTISAPIHVMTEKEGWQQETAVHRVA